MDAEFAAKLTRDRHFFRFWMPYLFIRLDVDGVRWAFLPLNRNYKPLGYTGSTRVDYADYALSHGVKFGRDPSKMSKVWTSSSEDGEMLWLYTDTPQSRADYFERFETVMSRSLPILMPRQR